MLHGGEHLVHCFVHQRLNIPLWERGMVDITAIISGRIRLRVVMIMRDKRVDDLIIPRLFLVGVDGRMSRGAYIYHSLDVTRVSLTFSCANITNMSIIYSLDAVGGDEASFKRLEYATLVN